MRPMRIGTLIQHQNRAMRTTKREMDSLKMMSRLLLAVAMILSLSAAAFAQSTTVSGTITDANGQAFAYGTYSVEFYTNGLPSPFNWNGTPLNPGTIYSGTLDSSGAFSGLSLPSNNFIAPTGTAWRFTFCSAATSPCYSQNVIITGSTMSLSAIITPPAIAVSLTNPPPTGAAAYSDSEINGARLGGQYFNITDNSMHVCTAPLCTWAVYSPVASLLAANNTWTGVNTYNNTVNLSSGGSLTGTFTGNPTLSGNPAFSGTPTFSNAISLPGLTLTTTPLPVTSGGTGTTTPGLVGGTAIGVSGTWPNQTISNTSAYASLADPLPVAHGGTGTASPGSTASGCVSVTGSFPTQAIGCEPIALYKQVTLSAASPFGSSSPSTITPLTVQVTTPASGCPCRIWIGGGWGMTAGGSATTESWITDDSSAPGPFASPARVREYVNTGGNTCPPTGNQMEGSPVNVMMPPDGTHTYGNNVTVTFTLHVSEAGNGQNGYVCPTTANGNVATWLTATVLSAAN
jgi:hypothetical protein